MKYSLTLLLLLAAASSVLAADSPTRPNIVLVMADDQGWGDTGYNGHPELKTPHLDALAASGLRLDRFYAAHCNCSPTRGSVMTGRHPNRMGVFWPGDWTPVLALAIGSQVVGQGLIVYAVRHLSPLVVGLSLLVQPAISAGVGAWRFVEVPGPWEFFGAALVVAALVIARLPSRR